MPTSNLLFKLRQNGYALQADGDYLSISPAHNLPTELIEKLKQNKQGILSELQREEEARKSSPVSNEPTPVIEQLYGFTLEELKHATQEDWATIKANRRVLETFASALFVKQQRERGEVPAHYTAKTECLQCGEVPISPSLVNGGKVLSCPWCANRHLHKPMPSHPANGIIRA